ncbi:hypothetical protein F5878DRAFT_728674 [Lentinula raphanica]|uniref:Uncharacterized protein n=1 Tax=Lentinula raphanica TaxID=153919 RepID=A0AA38P026_9AGAR|nr:hypothetical protein F5878DRAFT_728674 [Lentinula raphanica]
MDKYSCVAWHTNPNASASLTDTEREHARKLFTNTEVAWNHPALQECLKRHIRMAKTDRQSSNMNTITLFSVIWKYECPGSRNSHSVWTAMRAELDGMLTELVSHFHVYTKGEDGTGESSSRVRNSNSSRDNQEQRRARGTTDAGELGLQQKQYSPNFASTTVPMREHVAGEIFMVSSSVVTLLDIIENPDSGPDVSNRFFTSSPEPNLQLHFPYAEPVAGESDWRRIVEALPNSNLGFPSNVGIVRAAPDVYNPIFEQSSGSHLVQSFVPGAQQNTMSSDLASASYAAMSHALRLDPFAHQDGSHVYRTGPEQSTHFSYSPGAQQNALEPSYLVPPYATLDPDIWQREQRNPLQWTHYQTENRASSFDPSMAAHTVSISPQDNHTLDSQIYGNSRFQKVDPKE